jgi:ubiquinone/menaquinone biosynthesis C-methylase UbiE
MMGRTSEEYERLRRQAAFLEPATRSVLDRVGLANGMRCLDVGCGPGEVMRLMAERVGPSGRVVGLDLDHNLGRESVSSLVGKGHGQCTFVEGDLYGVEHLDDQPFDLVFARIVFFHLADPISALQKMFSWLKLGGQIVIQDYYFASLDSHPFSEAANEVNRVFATAGERIGRDMRVGIKLPSYFIDSGIGSPDGTDVADFYGVDPRYGSLGDTDVSGNLLPARMSAQMLGAVYRSVLPVALTYGVTTEEQSALLFEQLEGWRNEDSYFLWPLLISAWKKKSS